MRYNTELFELVKSLNKNEKRYFRLSTVSGIGTKKYGKLFDILDKQNKYDETAIKSLLKDRNLKKHFAFHKNYLKKMILRSLIMFNANTQIDSMIQRCISEAKILFKKALYKQYFRAIVRAKNLAIKYERFGYCLEILDMEKIVIKKDELQTQKMKHLYLQIYDTLDKFKNIFEYSGIISMLLTYYRDTGIRREEEQDKKLQLILRNPLLKDLSFALSLKAKENFFRIKQLIGEAMGDYDTVFENLKKRMSVINKNPEMFKESVIDLRIDVLVDMLNTCIRLNKLNEYERYLKQLYSTDVKIESERIDLEITLTLLRFRLLIVNKHYLSAYNYISEVERILQKYENRILIDSELTLRFYIVKTLILAKKYDQGLVSVNRLMGHRLINKRKDYKFYLKILNLIIHFELKNYGLLNHLIRSTYRSLSKNRQLYKTEVLILKFLRKLPELKDEKNRLKHLEDFRNKLNDVKKLTYEKNAFEYFDFLDWVNEKITEVDLK